MVRMIISLGAVVVGVLAFVFFPTNFIGDRPEPGTGFWILLCAVVALVAANWPHHHPKPFSGAHKVRRR